MATGLAGAIGSLILLAVMIGVYLWTRRRNRSNDRVTEAATREQYKRPENYEARREELKKEVRPS